MIKLDNNILYGLHELDELRRKQFDSPCGEFIYRSTFIYLAIWVHDSIVKIIVSDVEKTNGRINIVPFLRSKFTTHIMKKHFKHNVLPIYKCLDDSNFESILWSNFNKIIDEKKLFEWKENSSSKNIEEIYDKLTNKRTSSEKEEENVLALTAKDLYNLYDTLIELRNMFAHQLEVGTYINITESELKNKETEIVNYKNLINGYSIYSLSQFIALGYAFVVSLEEISNNCHKESFENIDAINSN